MNAMLTPGGRHALWTPGGVARWVLLDVDGTLLGPTGRVAPTVVDAVDAVREAGIAVGYATGRNVEGVADLEAQVDMPGPHVVLNGAQVRRDGHALQTWPITDEQLSAILAFCTDEGFYAELYLEEGFLVTEMDRRYQPHWDEVIGWPAGTIEDRPPRPGEVIKATIVTLNDAGRDHVVATVRAMGLSAGAATSPQTPGLTYVNITRADVDKGAAVTAAAVMLGIGLDEVVVIGDGANDLPMLQVAGTAIAMGQSAEEVRASAHLVTGTVEDDGAATALRAVLEGFEVRAA